MMFKWNFSFDWFDDGNGDVPILSGGLLLVTRKWWDEAGGYDDGMMQWGGENIEQSLRCWMCGGEIVVERKSMVGHIFWRPAPPQKVMPHMVERNQGRAAFVWLDDYYKGFSQEQPSVKHMDLGRGLLERSLFRFAYNCHNFQWWLNRFYDVFEAQGLLVEHQHNIRHVPSGLCLEASGDAGAGWKVVMALCNKSFNAQRWGFIKNRKRIVNSEARMCVDRGNDAYKQHPILYQCDTGDHNANQLFMFTNTESPPLNADRNFHSLKTFTGRIVSPSKLVPEKQVLSSAELAAQTGQCLGFDVDSARRALVRQPPEKPRVKLMSCEDAAVLDNKAFTWDLIW